MRAVVCKFGGSATASAEGFRRIRDLLRQNPERRCAVLSAPGIAPGHGEKVTAMLEALFKSRGDARARDDLLEGVLDRYRLIAAGLGLEGDLSWISREIDCGMSESRAHLLSRGEYICARLFSVWSGMELIDAARVVAFREDGRLDERETLARLSRVSETGGPFILPGFYGADGRGRVHLLPRNGSDITGALAAAGMSAALYENRTDVPGLMTADPATVPGARLIPRISYRQMRKLSRAGARVLHPACLDPVAEAGIPTRLRHFMRPDYSGTLIDERCAETAPCIVARCEETAAGTGTAGRTLLSHIDTRPREISGKGNGFDREVLGVVPRSGENISEAGIDTGVENPGAVASPDKAASLDTQGRREISVFGLPIARVAEVAADLDARDWRMADQCLSFTVPAPTCDSAVRALHRRLIETRSGTR